MASIMFTSKEMTGGGGSTTKKTTKRKVTPASVKAKMKGEAPMEPTLMVKKTTKKKKKNS
jgi:hypothetical protein